MSMYALTLIVDRRLPALTRIFDRRRAVFCVGDNVGC